MDPDLKWVIGIGVTVMTFLSGVFVGALYRLWNKVTGFKDDLAKEVQEVRRTYVRRDDFADYAKRIEDTIRDMRQEMRDGTKQVIEAVQRSKD
jgi:hypothetical protein